MLTREFRSAVTAVLAAIVWPATTWPAIILPAIILPAIVPAAGCSLSAAESRPNIVWIIVDDMSANFSCYGETAISTPHVDQLAADGIRFTNAYVTAPVCSTCRSAFITGMYQTSIGAHHHRSGRGEQKIRLPEHIRPVPQLFQEAGYRTYISGWSEPAKVGAKPGAVRGGKGKGGKPRYGKTDYNFEWDAAMYDGVSPGETEDRPFFWQIQTPGGKRRGGDWASNHKFQKQCEQIFGAAFPIDEVTLPPYYPADPVLLTDWAAYLDSCRYTDRLVGQVIERLKRADQWDNTVLLFMTDHGISHARGKQFLYDEGLHVPLVIAGAGIPAGVTRDDLVEHIDIAALSLGLAGIEIPSYMQGRDILADDYQPRDYAFAARDRCDETVDHIRSVRTKRFKYIRNYLPERPLLQPCAYKDKKGILVALRAAREAGTLSNLQQQLLFSETRAPEELYDLQKDPHELHNLASEPSLKKTLVQLRERLDQWVEETGDQGAVPESEMMYDSDMAVYLNTIRRKNNPVHLQRIEDNIAQMKAWAAAGK